MASPYYQCPQCHSVSRKNDNMFQMVEISGPNTVFAVAGAAPCPDCGARNNFDDVYVHPKYDVPIEDVYGGKHGVNLQLVRRASEAGQIRLSEEEKRLLRQATESGRDSAVQSTGPWWYGILRWFGYFFLGAIIVGGAGGLVIASASSGSLSAAGIFLLVGLLILLCHLAARGMDTEASHGTKMGMAFMAAAFGLGIPWFIHWVGEGAARMVRGGES